MSTSKRKNSSATNFNELLKEILALSEKAIKLSKGKNLEKFSEKKLLNLYEKIAELWCEIVNDYSAEFKKILLSQSTCVMKILYQVLETYYADKDDDHSPSFDSNELKLLHDILNTVENGIKNSDNEEEKNSLIDLLQRCAAFLTYIYRRDADQRSSEKEQLDAHLELLEREHLDASQKLAKLQKLDNLKETKLQAAKDNYQKSLEYSNVTGEDANQWDYRFQIYKALGNICFKEFNRKNLTLAQQKLQEIKLHYTQSYKFLNKFNEVAEKEIKMTLESEFIFLKDQLAHVNSLLQEINQTQLMSTTQTTQTYSMESEGTATATVSKPSINCTASSSFTRISAALSTTVTIEVGNVVYNDYVHDLKEITAINALSDLSQKYQCSSKTSGDDGSRAKRARSDNSNDNNSLDHISLSYKK